MDIIHELGNVVATKNLYNYVEENEFFNTFVRYCLSLYVSGDWGALPKNVWEENDISVKSGGRIFASYPIPKELQKDIVEEDRVLIITDEDRSTTTIAFPSEL